MTHYPDPVRFEVAISEGWRSTSWTWTDLSYRVRETDLIKIARQRSFFTAELATGSAGLILDNSDGWCYPKNSESPLWPSIPWDPLGCPARLYDLVAGAEYPLFRGFVNAWDPQKSEDGTDEFVPVELVDAWGIIAPIPVTGSFPEELSSVRIGRILDAIGWPAALRDIEVGLVTMQASEHTKEPALQLLKQVMDSELGSNLHVSFDGKIVFQNQDYRILGAGSTVQATFSHYRGFPHAGLGQTPFRRDRVRNSATVQRIGGVEQTYTDAASEADYGPQPIAKRDNMLMTTDAIALSQAETLVSWEREPLVYVDRLTLVDQNDFLLYTKMVTLKPGDAIHVEEEAAGDDISEDVYVESASLDIGQQGADRKTYLQTSPAAFSATWILDDDVMSVLDETTILGAS